jgi:perosamine synthetase
MKELIPMSAPDVDESDIQAVLSVLRSGRLSLGPATEGFEAAMASYVGTRHAVAVSSGTAALHLIVRALGIGEGDEVLVPSFTFAASVNVLLYERAIPVFVDIEPKTYNLNPDDLRRKITPRTRAILAVDVFGHPCEWDTILALAREHGLKVIDDSCEALGAEYCGRKLGQFGDAAAFAFYPNKQITTGEGGMIVTDDYEIARLCRSLRNQGRGQMGPWLEHERLGFNYRMDEMSGALGLSQLRRIEEFLGHRQHVASLYSARFTGMDWLRPPSVRPNVRMSWFVYVITLAEGIDRAAVARAAGSRGVPVRAYFSPVHLQRYIIDCLGNSQGLALTESIAKRTLAIPFHNKLTVTEIEAVVDALAASVNEHVRHASA